MSGAENPEVIDRWKTLAQAESDQRRKAQLGTIALLFARRVDRNLIWEEKLKGWNVEESTYVNEWIAVGEKRGRAEGEAEGEARGIVAGMVATILELGTERFGPPPTETEGELRAITDRDRLTRIVRRMSTATDWANLLATL